MGQRGFVEHQRAPGPAHRPRHRRGQHHQRRRQGSDGRRGALPRPSDARRQGGTRDHPARPARRVHHRPPPDTRCVESHPRRRCEHLYRLDVGQPRRVVRVRHGDAEGDLDAGPGRGVQRPDAGRGRSLRKGDGTRGAPEGGCRPLGGDGGRDVAGNAAQEPDPRRRSERHRPDQPGTDHGFVFLVPGRPARPRPPRAAGQPGAGDVLRALLRAVVPAVRGRERGVHDADAQ